MGLISFSNIGKIKEEDEIPDITGLSKPKVKKRNLQKIITDNNTRIVTKDLSLALFNRFANHRYIINNAKIFGIWEADFITVTESMYVYEIECKMTKSDFNDDFSKVGKHSLYESSDGSSNLQRPNKFYYCTPRGMLASHEIPVYAGLMEVSRVKGELQCVTVKEAPFLHKEDVFSSIKDSLLQKLAWRYRDIMLKDHDNIINILTDREN